MPNRAAPPPNSSWIQNYKSLRAKCEMRLKEQETGQYDWLALHRASEKNPNEIPDVADYIGPVDFVDMPERPSGKGVITTRSVEPGELLFVTKPFVYASAHEFPIEVLRAWVIEDRSINDKPYYELMGRAVRRLIGSRTAAGALFQALHTDRDTSNRTPLAPSANLLKTGTRPWTDSTEHEPGDINLENIRAILKEHMCQEPVKMHPEGFARGVCLAQEIVNHACEGTALRSSIGPVFFMRASRHLSKGEEVTCSAIGSHDVASFLGRKGPLSRWLANCECSLCEADRTDGPQKCIKVMGTLAALKHQLGQENLARHWAVAALWTDEAFYGPGKQYMWESLGVKSNNKSLPLVALLKDF
ncbi:SET domain protein [Ceratobasidium sp. AG-Ba]|nr:SET domain protein [Ceratobasidium sp. AG-Ba]